MRLFGHRCITESSISLESQPKYVLSRLLNISLPVTAHKSLSSKFHADGSAHTYYRRAPQTWCAEKVQRRRIWKFDETHDVRHSPVTSRIRLAEWDNTAWTEPFGGPAASSKINHTRLWVLFDCTTEENVFASWPMTPEPRVSHYN